MYHEQPAHSHARSVSVGTDPAVMLLLLILLLLFHRVPVHRGRFLRFRWVYIFFHGISMTRKLKLKENRNCYALRVRDNFPVAFNKNCERRENIYNNSHHHVLKFAHSIHRCQHRFFSGCIFLVRENEWINEVVTAASRFTFRCEYFNGKYSFLSILFVVSVYFGPAAHLHFSPLWE